MDPTAPLRAAMDLQREMMRSWFDLVTLPFAALGGGAPLAPPSAPKKREAVAPAAPAPAPKPPLAVVPKPAAPAKAEPPAAPVVAAELAPLPAARVAAPAPAKAEAPAPVKAEVPAKAAAPAPAKPAPAPAKAEAPSPAKAAPLAAVKPPAPPAEASVEKPVAAKPRAAAKPAAPAIDPAGLFDDDAVEKAQPPVLKKPDGAEDDLLVIKGIGPKLKQLLNDVGVYHYRQIAAWTPGEIAWINAKIDFKGRVQREKWVAQARELAKKG